MSIWKLYFSIYKVLQLDPEKLPTVHPFPGKASNFQPPFFRSYVKLREDTAVSKNRGGPPKSSILIGFGVFHEINHPFWGPTPIFWKGWFIMNNPIKMDDLGWFGGIPIFGNTRSMESFHFSICRWPHLPMAAASHLVIMNFLAK